MFSILSISSSVMLGIDLYNTVIASSCLEDIFFSYRFVQLHQIVQESYPGTFKMFSNLMCMKEKGYFKNVDPGKELKEILKNCVVI